MYTGTYAPWEHYPKTLSHHEVQNPMAVLVDFFSVHSVKGHARHLRGWRHCVVNKGYYRDRRHGPGVLLFLYDLNLKLLEAMYLLWLQHRHPGSPRSALTTAQLEQERAQWNYYPENLSLKEQLNPYRVVKKVFAQIKPQGYRDELRHWLHAALYKRPDDDGLPAARVILVYDNLLRMYSAAWLIHQRRESGHSEKNSCCER